MAQIIWSEAVAQDHLSGGDGADTLNGGDGGDLLFGGPDADLLNGDAGGDSVDGGPGDDSVNGGVEQDTLAGGPGIDLLGARDRFNDVVYCGGGADPGDPRSNRRHARLQWRPTRPRPGDAPATGTLGPGEAQAR